MSSNWFLNMVGHVSSWYTIMTANPKHIGILIGILLFICFIKWASIRRKAKSKQPPQSLTKKAKIKSGLLFIASIIVACLLWLLIGGFILPASVHIIDQPIDDWWKQTVQQNQYAVCRLPDPEQSVDVFPSFTLKPDEREKSNYLFYKIEKADVLHILSLARNKNSEVLSAQIAFEDKKYKSLDTGYVDLHHLLDPYNPNEPKVSELKAHRNITVYDYNNTDSKNTSSQINAGSIIYLFDTPKEWRQVMYYSGQNCWHIGWIRDYELDSTAANVLRSFYDGLSHIFP